MGSGLGIVNESRQTLPKLALGLWCGKYPGGTTTPALNQLLSTALNHYPLPLVSFGRSGDGVCERGRVAAVHQAALAFTEGHGALRFPAADYWDHAFA